MPASGAAFGSGAALGGSAGWAACLDRSCPGFFHLPSHLPPAGNEDPGVGDADAVEKAILAEGADSVAIDTANLDAADLVRGA